MMWRKTKYKTKKEADGFNRLICMNDAVVYRGHRGYVCVWYDHTVRTLVA